MIVVDGQKFVMASLRESSMTLKIRAKGAGWIRPNEYLEKI
jgi:hypothetical protein